MRACEDVYNNNNNNNNKKKKKNENNNNTKLFCSCCIFIVSVFQEIKILCITIWNEEKKKKTKKNLALHHYHVPTSHMLFPQLVDVQGLEKLV